MTNIVEYITQNYFIILFFAVLILLAVIGYFAEKANNAQRDKNKEEINNQPEERNIEGMVFDSNTGKLVNAEEIKKEESINIDESVSISSNIESNETANFDVNQNSSELNILEPSNLQENNAGINYEQKKEEFVQQNSNISNQQVLPIQQNSNEVQIQDSKDSFESEEFAQFSLEFDSILPKKEIIDTDLLSDIDSLELDKTQKLDLNGVPDLDNIDLPKIKQMTEEQDIWKF